MKLPILSDTQSLCDQCVALCCRYYAMSIDEPKAKRDFEDIRWYMLHKDTIVFVEDGEWYLQVNSPCKELLPDNRCGIYHNRPTICRAYTTKNCDWHGEEYDYDHLFTEPDQLQAFSKEYLAKKRKRKSAAKRKKAGKPAAASKPRARQAAPKRKTKKKAGVALHLLKSA